MYTVNNIFDIWTNIFKQNVDYLTELDSVAGDADLGLVMNDGFSKVSEYLKTLDQPDAGMRFYMAGKYFNQVASSSMGTLLSAGFMNVGKKLKGKTEIVDEDFYTIVFGIAESIQNIGKAKEGEKTFLDGILPAVRELEKTGDIKQKLDNALVASKEGVEKAKNLIGKHGRIAFRGEGSIGIIDPGSVVAMLLVQGLKEIVQ